MIYINSIRLLSRNKDGIYYNTRIPWVHKFLKEDIFGIPLFFMLNWVTTQVKYGEQFWVRDTL